jgi:DNA invertase Pin-like site-specific DNA recombinase
MRPLSPTDVISSASTPAAAAADPASAVAAEPSRATSYALAYDAASDAALDALAALAPGDDETDDLAGPESARRRWRSPREDVIATFRSAARTTEQKLPEYARRRGLALFVRTSTKEQADSGTRGSPTAQLEAGYDDAARLGVARDEVKLIDAWGEAGTRKAKRKKFRELRALVRSGGVGVVIAPEHHRISRNVSDAEAFFQECADMRVLLLINGQPFDPRVPTDRYMLGMMAQFAQYENDARVRWLMRGKLQRAKNLAARYRLPAGLVWASPHDPAYVQAAHNAGLGHYLRRTRDHSAKSPTAHLTLYVLPFPTPRWRRARASGCSGYSSRVARSPACSSASTRRGRAGHAAVWASCRSRWAARAGVPTSRTPPPRRGRSHGGEAGRLPREPEPVRPVHVLHGEPSRRRGGASGAPERHARELLPGRPGAHVRAPARRAGPTRRRRPPRGGLAVGDR